MTDLSTIGQSSVTGTSLQARYFPDDRLGHLLDVVDGIRNRPTFEEMVALLDKLFVGLLRYERDGLDVTSRAGLPPSAVTRCVRSVARLGGVRIFAVEREGASFHDEAMSVTAGCWRIERQEADKPRHFFAGASGNCRASATPPGRSRWWWRCRKHHRFRRLFSFGPYRRSISVHDRRP